MLAAWSGLGYYARARNLRRAAREIVAKARRRASARSRRAAPAAGIRRLHGRGRGLARLRRARARGRRQRDARRLAALRDSGPRRLARATAPPCSRDVAELLPADGPGDLTAALMDLGQAICTAAPSRLRALPARGATARAGGAAGRRRIPGARRSRARCAVALAAAVLERRGRALLLRRRDGFLAGMWEFPCGPARPGTPRRAGAPLPRPRGARPGERRRPGRRRPSHGRQPPPRDRGLPRPRGPAPPGRRRRRCAGSRPGTSTGPPSRR